jgi:tetratricopeptide (TPR) repeat protein
MNQSNAGETGEVRARSGRAVGPRLRYLLWLVLGLTAILGANSAYLSGITFLEWAGAGRLQNYFYLVMFSAHLVLGLLLIVPFVGFGILHLLKARYRPNRRAVKVGYALFTVSLVVLVTGVALMRIGDLHLRDPQARALMYWLHVIAPLVAVWLYVLHRLVGPRIRWQYGLQWAMVVLILMGASVWLHLHPGQVAQGAAARSAPLFEPSLARTASGGYLPASSLMMDTYCQKCHADAYQGWFHSAHHFSSFNNQFYLFSVRETRRVALERDGSVKASRWCAGCHDLVPLFSGAFDDPKYDQSRDSAALAGITCTGCHAITECSSTVGNGAYTIGEPVHYPFAYQSNRWLQLANQTLVKAKPDFHKQTFLKPVHRSAEFCSVCHKVSIPGDLNHYKEFLRGQNHYDGYLLSGVSGHGARSFYYPERSQTNCAGCHMPLQVSADFGAKFFNPTNPALTIHDHLFPAANTALPFLRGDTNTLQREIAFLKGSVRVDLFGVREGGTVDSPLLAPLRPQMPPLKPGGRYLLEVVVRTLRLGHPFTQGTADSNELWVDVTLLSGNRILGRSGGLGPRREVDPWAHFFNIYMLDRNGRRIDRRNVQDIFTPLYNHQFPPGAAQVAHYEFQVPEDLSAPITVEARVQYRKFDALYFNFVNATNFASGQGLWVTNDLPIVTLAEDRLTLPLSTAGAAADSAASPIPEWQRWNDYGIALFLEGDRGSEKGELIQAADAFARVEKLGRADGPLNQARVYFKEGRLDDAVSALQRAMDAQRFQPPAPRWTVAWLNALVNKQNGQLDTAIGQLRGILEDRYTELDKRGFDFSADYEVINELGLALFERAKLERSDHGKRRQFLADAATRFEQTLNLDSENLTAHYNLALIHAQLGNHDLARQHRQLHEKYRPDDNARDRAITIARRTDAAADHAAQAIVIYPLQRSGAFH